MSRCGYSYDLDQQDMAMWRGRVASAIRGKRGQQLLHDIIAALDAMPVKELVPHELVCEDGVCTLGAVGQYRNVADLDKFDPGEHDVLGNAFDVSPCLIQEIEFHNDDWESESPADRWKRMRAWAVKHLKAYKEPTP